MKPIRLPKFVAAALFAIAALGAAPAAQARTDVQISIGLPGLPILLAPPVIVHPHPVYVDPRSIYRPGLEHRRDGRYGEWQRRAWERRAWERREWERRAWERREWERRAWEHRQRHRSPSHGRDWD